MSITDDTQTPKEENIIADVEPLEPDVIAVHKGRKIRKTKKYVFSAEGKNGKKVIVDFSNLGIEPICYMAMDVLNGHLSEDPSVNNQLAISGIEMVQKGLQIIAAQKAQYDKEQQIKAGEI